MRNISWGGLEAVWDYHADFLVEGENVAVYLFQLRNRFKNLHVLEDVTPFFFTLVIFQQTLLYCSGCLLQLLFLPNFLLLQLLHFEQFLDKFNVLNLKLDQFFILQQCTFIFFPSLWLLNSVQSKLSHLPYKFILPYEFTRDFRDDVPKQYIKVMHKAHGSIYFD